MLRIGPPGDQPCCVPNSIVFVLQQVPHPLSGPALRALRWWNPVGSDSGVQPIAPGSSPTRHYDATGMMFPPGGPIFLPARAGAVSGKLPRPVCEHLQPLGVLPLLL